MGGGRHWLESSWTLGQWEHYCPLWWQDWSSTECASCSERSWLWGKLTRYPCIIFNIDSSQQWRSMELSLGYNTSEMIADWKWPSWSMMMMHLSDLWFIRYSWILKSSSVLVTGVLAPLNISGHGCKQFHAKMKNKSKKNKDLMKYTMPATIALRWCFTNCNGDLHLLRKLMNMMRKHFEGNHSKCVHPFTAKCSETKIESSSAREQFQVSDVMVQSNCDRQFGINTTTLQPDILKGWVPIS